MADPGETAYDDLDLDEDVDLDDLYPESLWRFRVRGFGPLLVAMDSHGGSLYSKVRDAAQARRAEALRRLGVG